jgi:hypothetical protein
VAVAVADAVAAAAAAAAESVVDAVDAEVAAAALASGAVAEALPEAGVAAGASVSATVVGITTATAFGAVADAAAGCDEPAGSVEELAAEGSPDDESAVDFAASSFEAVDFVRERWGPSVLALLLASEDCPAGASWLFELFLADWSAAELSRGGLLSAAVDVSLDRRGAADCSCAMAAARSLAAAAAAALLSTSAAKLSFPADRSGVDRAGLGGAPWKDTFAAASDVTLTTGGLSRWNWTWDQQGPGHPKL